MTTFLSDDGSPLNVSRLLSHKRQAAALTQSQDEGRKRGMRPVTIDARTRPWSMAIPRSVLLLGATGLVGGECLRLLQAHTAFDRLVVLTRRPLGVNLLGPRVEHHIVDFDHLTSAAAFFSVDQIICALGTTMKQAGSRRQFRTVDLLYPLTAAHLGVEKKVSHFLVVTALGADPRSPIFYNRIKGELEQALIALPYHSLTIARPSVLVGRLERRRAGERIAAGISFLAPARIRPIDAADVAAAIVHQAALDQPGKRVLESVELRQIAGSARSAAEGAVPPLGLASKAAEPSVA